MPFSNLLDNPVIGDHNPLILGWRDEQLHDVVNALRVLMPPDMTDGMRLAVASCARSMVTEHKTTGNGVRYSRAKELYRLPRRYRGADPSYTWHYVTKSMDLLERVGLVEQFVGMWVPQHKGFQSVAYATDEMMDRLGPLIDIVEERGISGNVETIVLRHRVERCELDYVETSKTTTLRAEVQIVNDALAETLVRHGERKLEIPLGRRIFNGSFDRGGRFYCHGPSFQNMPATERRELEMVIGGVAHPMVEIDYSNLHIEMAYREKRRRMRPGDQYAIEGFDRTLVKVAVNIVLNARSEHAAVLAISDALFTGEIEDTDPSREGTRKSYRTLATTLVSAIKRKHHRIANYFGSDCGAKFQRRDSDMAMEIMRKMIRRTGRCPLPVHDSFLVADIDETALAETMREVAHSYKVHPTLKILRPGGRSSLSYMEVTASELGKQGQHSSCRTDPINEGYTVTGSQEDHVSSNQTAALRYGHDPPPLNPWLPGDARSNRGDAEDFQARTSDGPDSTLGQRRGVRRRVSMGDER